jgi:Tfp pilus assembly protein PilF
MAQRPQKKSRPPGEVQPWWRRDKFRAVLLILAILLAYQPVWQASEAIQQFETAVQIKPDYAEVYYNMGNALLLMNRPVEAQLQFEQALRIKPDLAAARDNLTRLQTLQNAAPAKK